MEDVWTGADRNTRNGRTPLGIRLESPCDLVAHLTDFTFALREAGVCVTMDQTMRFLRAVDAVPRTDAEALYVLGQSLLCRDPQDRATYDVTFAKFVPLFQLLPAGSAVAAAMADFVWSTGSAQDSAGMTSEANKSMPDES